MKTEGHAGDLLKKTIRVECDDPTNSNLVLTISVKVRDYAEITPRRINFAGKLNEAITRSVTIAPDSDYPFSITGFHFTREPAIPCSLTTREGASGKEYVLTLEFPNDKRGNLSNTLMVETDNRKVASLKIPISGYVTAPPTPTETPAGSSHD